MPWEHWKQLDLELGRPILDSTNERYCFHLINYDFILIWIVPDFYTCAFQGVKYSLVSNSSSCRHTHGELFRCQNSATGFNSYNFNCEQQCSAYEWCVGYASIRDSCTLIPSTPVCPDPMISIDGYVATSWTDLIEYPTSEKVFESEKGFICKAKQGIPRNIGLRKFRSEYNKIKINNS